MSKRKDNPYAGGRGPKPLPLDYKLARSSVRDVQTGCLVWVGGTDKDGYGKVWHERTTMRTHRARWLVEHGAPPAPHLFVLHRCDNPPCHEPSHLYVGTQRDNMTDRLVRGRWRGGRKRKEAQNAE